MKKIFILFMLVGLSGSVFLDADPAKGGGGGGGGRGGGGAGRTGGAGRAGGAGVGRATAGRTSVAPSRAATRGTPRAIRAGTPARARAEKPTATTKREVGRAERRADRVGKPERRALRETRMGRPEHAKGRGVSRKETKTLETRAERKAANAGKPFPSKKDSKSIEKAGGVKASKDKSLKNVTKGKGAAKPAKVDPKKVSKQSDPSHWKWNKNKGHNFLGHNWWWVGGLGWAFWWGGFWFPWSTWWPLWGWPFWWPTWLPYESVEYVTETRVEREVVEVETCSDDEDCDPSEYCNLDEHCTAREHDEFRIERQPVQRTVRNY